MEEWGTAVKGNSGKNKVSICQSLTLSYIKHTSWPNSVFLTLKVKEVTALIFYIRASLMAQQVKNLPATQETQETQVRSLGWEAPLEEEMATHSNILPEKSHGQRSLVGYSPEVAKGWI